MTWWQVTAIFLGGVLLGCLGVVVALAWHFRDVFR